MRQLGAVIAGVKAEVLVTDHLLVGAHLGLGADLDRPPAAGLHRLQRRDRELLLQRLGGEERDAAAGCEGELDRGIEGGGGLADAGGGSEQQVTAGAEGLLDRRHRLGLHRAYPRERKRELARRLAPRGARALPRLLGRDQHVQTRTQVGFDLARRPRDLLEAVLVAAEVDEQETDGRAAVREKAPPVQPRLPAESFEPLVRKRMVEFALEAQRLDLLDYGPAVVPAGEAVGASEHPHPPAVRREGGIDGDLARVTRVGGVTLGLDGPVQFGAHRQAGKPLPEAPETGSERLGEQVVDGARHLPGVEVDADCHRRHSTRRRRLEPAAGCGFAIDCHRGREEGRFDRSDHSVRIRGRSTVGFLGRRPSLRAMENAQNLGVPNLVRFLRGWTPFPMGVVLSLTMRCNLARQMCPQVQMREDTERPGLTLEQREAVGDDRRASFETGGAGRRPACHPFRKDGRQTEPSVLRRR